MVFAQLPQSTLKKWKDATAFIEVKKGKETVSRGAAVLVRQDPVRKAGFFVTRARLVDAAASGAQGEWTISLILQTSTEKETVLPAEVLAIDRTSDLAMLKVTNDAPTKAIGLDRNPSPRETLSIFILQSPPTGIPGATRRTPLVFSPGKITSLFLDAYGVLTSIHITGGIGSDFSGAPVIDEAGILIGLAASDEGPSKTGTVVPWHRIRAFLNGTTGPLRLERAQTGAGTVSYKVETDRIDPFGQITRASLICARQDATQKTVPSAPLLEWRSLPSGSHEVAMKEEKGQFTGMIEMKARPGIQEWHLFQIRCVHSSGLITFSAPFHELVRYADTTPPQPRPAHKASVAPDGKNMKTGTRDMNGSTLHTLDIQAQSVVRDVIPSLDGQSLYVLERSGSLSRMAVPECIQTVFHRIDHECSAMTVSSAGLVVNVSGLREIWVLDEKTLAVKMKIRARAFDRITSARSLSVVFGKLREERGTLWVMDLRTGKETKSYTTDALRQAVVSKPVRHHKDSVLLNEFFNPTVSPDGRYLFCMSMQCLARLQIGGTDGLIYEEIGPRLRTAVQIAIDSDSQYVSVPGSANPGQIADHPQIKGSYLYRIDNLQMPVLALPSETDVQAVAFDTTSKVVYVGARQFLEIHSPSDSRVLRYSYGDYMDRVSSIVPAAKGRGLFLLSELKAYWIDLPAK